MSKYHAVKTVRDGNVFASKAEARRYDELKIMQLAGEISHLECHPRYPLIVSGIGVGYYEADFRYTENKKTVVEDVKGVRTPVYSLKKKMIKAQYKIDIQEVKA